MLFNNEDDQRLNEEKQMRMARESLSRIKQSREESNIDLLQEHYSNLSSVDRGKYLFEEFDSIVWEGKIKVDMMYYDQLFQKLDETQTEQVEKLLSSMYKDVHNIYEFINVKPELHGSDVTFDILNESMSSIHKKLSKVIYEFLDRKFYDLPLQERCDRYQERSKEDAKQLMVEGTTPEEAIKFSVKTVLAEDLLDTIAFPFSIRSRLNHLLENADYGEIFDQDKLQELTQTYEKKRHNVAKIVSAIV